MLCLPPFARMRGWPSVLLLLLLLLHVAAAETMQVEVGLCSRLRRCLESG